MQENPEDNQLPSNLDEVQPLLYERSATPLCRICLESDGELLTACDCSGTQGLIHRKCVREWVTKYSNDPERCELCKAPWKIEMYPPCEKCMQRWNWCMTMGAWYVTIVFVFFTFHAASRAPLEFGAFGAYMVYMGVLHASWPCINIGLYRIFRTTISIGLALGMVTLMSGQQDYRDRKDLILGDRWASTGEKNEAIQMLRDEYEVDNPWQWEAEGKGGNRQDWLIVWTDIILWAGFYIYVKVNRIISPNRVVRLSSDSSNEGRYWSSSSEDSDAV